MVSAHSFQDSSLLYPFHWPFALSLICGLCICDHFSKGNNFTDLQIIWHTHTQIRCLLCICLVSFYLLFFPSFGCPYFCNIWPILWGNMVLLIADACESWDSVPIYFHRWTLRDLWKIAHVPSFSWEQQWWVKLLSLNECRCISAGSDQERPLEMYCSHPSFVCVAGWSCSMKSGFPLGAAERVLEGFGSWIPLQLIRQKSPEIGSLVQSTFLHTCVPVGALPDHADV